MVAIATCLAGIVFTSTIVTAQNTDVYVVVEEGSGNTRCKLWKNGVETNLTTYGHANSVFVSGNDVYVAGAVVTTTQYGNRGIARVWKNGVATNITDGTKDASAESVFVVGNDVYVAGYERYGPSNSLLDQIIAAKVWKNGVETVLSSSSFAKSVFVLGNDVYVAGYSTGGDEYVAQLWKNGAMTSLSDGTKTTYAESVFVSGSDVYVAGYEWSGGGSSVAQVWKNGVVSNLSAGTTYGYQSNSVFVLGNDVYVAGRENNLAQVWKNGVATNFINGTATTSSALSVFVYENDVYVSGNEGGFAKFWKNGVETVLTDGTNTFARATSIFVANNSSSGVSNIMSNSSVTYYPNPVKDELFIESETDIDKFEIYDIAGKQILTGNLSNEKSINVSALSAGTYLLKIGDFCNKFVKK